jgi:hypothetical protein
LELCEIAKVFNLPPKIDFNYDKINILNFLDKNIKNKAVQYCLRDVDIVNRFLTKISYSLNSLAPN